MQQERDPYKENKAPTPVPSLDRPPMKGMGGLIQMAAWGILFFMPFFFTGRQEQSITLESYLHFLKIPVSFMVIFYTNYHVLVKRYLFKKHTIRFITSNILLIAAVIFIVHLLPAPHDRPEVEHSWQEIIGFFLGNTILYILVAGLSVAIKMTNSWYATESARKEMEKNRTETELKNLKSQLNPHFLFNTLNNIYSLIAFSPDRAQEAVHDLSRLLRYVLYESSLPEVPLGKEIDFIRNYIELMRIRLPENVKVEVNVSPLINQEMKVAPLLFISLIENAFKHGVSNTHPSFIIIDIMQEEKQIHCLIRNSYFPKNTATDKNGSGIGLVNLRKRLSLLYPGAADFSCGQEGETYYSNLKITLL